MKLSLDSPIVDKTNQIADIIILGFLWLLTSIPIITIGPASIALYYAMVKSVRKKHDTAMNAFFYSFKQNFRQGIEATFLYLGYGGIIIYYILLAKSHPVFRENPYMTIAMGITITAPFIFTGLYIFPIISRFENVLLKQIFYALHMSVGNIITTGLLCVMLALVGFLIYLYPFLLIVLPGFFVYVSSLFIEKIFRRYTKKIAKDDRRQEELPWYLE